MSFSVSTSQTTSCPFILSASKTQSEVCFHFQVSTTKPADSKLSKYYRRLVTSTLYRTVSTSTAVVLTLPLYVLKAIVVAVVLCVQGDSTNCTTVCTGWQYRVLGADQEGN